MTNNFIKLIYAEFKRICTKGVCVYDIAAAVVVVFVYFSDYLGVGDVPMLGQLPRLQSAFLQERAHTAVEVNYIIFDKITNVH